MPALAPITPGSSIAITVAATSAVVLLPSKCGDQVMVTSLAGNAIAYIAFGDANLTVVAPTGTNHNGVPILPGTINIFTVPANATYIGSIGTAANTLYITGGDGS